MWQRIIPIDRAAKTAEVARGVVIPLDRPFFGTMGVAPPAAMGRISSGPPGVHTGNLDNKDLGARSEEHTSELQSQSNLVCRLLLEKKKIQYTSYVYHVTI